MGSRVVLRDRVFTDIVEFAAIAVKHLVVKEGLVDVVGGPFAVLGVASD